MDMQSERITKLVIEREEPTKVKFYTEEEAVALAETYNRRLTYKRSSDDSKEFTVQKGIKPYLVEAFDAFQFLLEGKWTRRDVVPKLGDHCVIVQYDSDEKFYQDFLDANTTIIYDEEGNEVDCVQSDDVKFLDDFLEDFLDKYTITSLFSFPLDRN